MLVRPHPELALTLKIRKLTLGDCTRPTCKGDGLGMVAARESLGGMGNECHLPGVAKEVVKRGQVGTHNTHGHSYWIGPKVLLGFSTSYGKTQTNILANSILLISSCVKVWPVISRQFSCVCVCVCVCRQKMVFRGPFTRHRHSE